MNDRQGTAEEVWRPAGNDGPLVVEVLPRRVHTRDDQRRECPDDEVLVVIRYLDRDRAVTNVL